LSRAVDVAFIEIAAKPGAYKRYRGPSHVHGAAQNRRELALQSNHVLGAPSFSPHRILGVRSLPRRRLGEGGSIRGFVFL
jgi:hypothetical protein